MSWVRWTVLYRACRLLPDQDRARYLAEWSAECDVVVAERGATRGLLYALRLGMGVPRTGFVLRTNNRPVFFDVLLMSITMSIPAVFFFVHGVVSDQRTVAVAYFALFVGLMVVASSAWTAESGLLGGRISFGGMFLVLLASVAITWVNRFADTNNPALDGPVRVLAGSLVAQVGVLFVMLSAWMGEYRVRAAHWGLNMMVVGLLVWGTLGVVNTVLVETWGDRIFHAISVPSIYAVAGVCWLIRRRDNELIMPRSLPDRTLV